MTKAIAIEPLYSDAYGFRSEFRREKGDMEGAQQDEKQAAEIRRKGDRKMKELEKRIAKTPDEPQRYSLRAHYKDRIKDLSGADADRRKAAELQKVKKEQEKLKNNFCLKHDTLSCRRSCLLGVLFSMVSIILFVGIGYFLFFYNPMQLIDRRTLTAAVNNGLLKECATLLGVSDTGSYRPAREEWPPAIKSLRPQKVIVHPPHIVTIALWENMRDWERKFSFGLGYDFVRLNIDTSEQNKKEMERNQEAGNPYFTRQIDSNIYLVYPKRWEEQVLKHTDLAGLWEKQGAGHIDK